MDYLRNCYQILRVNLQESWEFIVVAVQTHIKNEYLFGDSIECPVVIIEKTLSVEVEPNIQ